MVSLEEFEPALSVIDLKPIGSMLYVRVTAGGVLVRSKQQAAGGETMSRPSVSTGN